MLPITKILFIVFLENVVAHVVRENFPRTPARAADVSWTHLEVCARRHVCAANTTALCAVRHKDGVFEYRNFENSCFLFLSNICDHPGEEFAIARGGACRASVTSRRMFLQSGVPLPTAGAVGKGNTRPNLRTSNKTTTNKRTTTKKPFSKVYSTIDAFDGHVCPLRCHDVYAPVCLGANRGNGKFFKFWQFENHCAADMYYCKFWQRDFLPPEGESEEDVNSSPLAWSYCGAHRYLQFARFSESSSSMAHYGWLQGDFPYKHIMEPHQRKPGFG